ncbi:Disease resistance protein RUN1 [Linum perenne]
MNTFNGSSPHDTYTDSVEKVIAYAQGNPYALQVLSRGLIEFTLKHCESKARCLDRKPDPQIQSKMESTFLQQSNEAREVFLDIACFFIGKTVDYATEVLHASYCYDIQVVGGYSRTPSSLKRLLMNKLITFVGYNCDLAEQRLKSSQHELRFHALIDLSLWGGGGPPANCDDIWNVMYANLRRRHIDESWEQLEHRDMNTAYTTTTSYINYAQWESIAYHQHSSLLCERW